MKHIPILSMSAEAIRVQYNRSFHLELANAVDVIRQHGRRNPIEYGITASKISDVIAKYTGLNIKLNYQAEYNGCSVIPPNMDTNHPLLVGRTVRELGSRDATALLPERGDLLDTTVDLKTGMVSGAITKVPLPILIGNRLLGGDLINNLEVAAILLHEIGHCVVYLEQLGRITVTNYEIEAAVRRLEQTDDVKMRSRIINDVGSKLELKLNEVDELAKADNREIWSAVLHRESGKYLRTAFGVCVYDNRGFEQMADQYASRWMSGSSLLTGLDKMYGGVMAPHRHSRIRHWIGAIMSASAWIAVTVLVGSPALVIAMFTSAYIAGANYDTGVYDNPRERAIRIRNDMQGSLKNRKITKVERDQILDDIDIADGLIESYGDDRPITAVMLNFFSPGRRRDMNMMELQKNIAATLNNPMFARSAKFSQLAKEK